MKQATFKRKIAPIILAVIILVGISKANSQVPAFSGAWTRDDQKSKAPGVELSTLPAIIDLVISKNKLTIRRTVQEGQIVRSTYSEELKTDGGTSETITPSKLKRTASIQMLPDGNGFIETFTSKDEKGNIKQSGKNVFTMVGNERELKIESSLSVAGREFQMTLFYGKQ